MGKRAALAFFLSLLVIMSYNYYLAQKYPQQLRPGRVSAPEQLAPVAAAPEKPIAIPKASLTAGEATTAKEILVETDLAQIVLTSSGARIKSYTLKRYAEEKLSAQELQNQLAQIDRALLSASGEKQEQLLRNKNKQTLLQERISQGPQSAELISLAAALDADFSPAIIWPNNQELSLSLNQGLYQCSQDFLKLDRQRPEGRLEFTYVNSQGRKVKKGYSFSNSNYIIGLDIQVLDWPKDLLGSDYFLLMYGPDIGIPLALHGRRAMGYEGPLGCFSTGQQTWVQKEKTNPQGKDIFLKREYGKELGQILWAGLENKYFLAALIPSSSVDAMIVERNNYGEYKIGLKAPVAASSMHNFRLYLGPKKQDMLKPAGVTLEKSIDYGFFGPIAGLIYATLVFFSHWTHNFGWAIILLCIAVKVIFYPLTQHSFTSMQKMQREMKEIQPEMNALRAKLKDNPQKLNKEMMELYKRRGINPLASCQSGCLPLLLQMPVFFALYAVLYNAIELRGAPFIGWVSDLSAKDPFYILPILMGVSMFVQQKLTGLGGAGGVQEEQAKMMGIIMPVMLTWIFASLPSGVVLYWLVFNVLAILQQMLTKPKTEAAKPSVA